MNDRTYPILENDDEEFEKLKKNRFSYFTIEANKLVPIGVGNMVGYSELMELRDVVIAHAQEFGYPYRALMPNEKSRLDKTVGKLIYEKMDITPSVAATIPMWQFVNIKLLPDFIYWRFGESKDHYCSARRNYFGTQWWRYYLFCIYCGDEKSYYSMTDRNIADLYERSNTCGLSGHIVDEYRWFVCLYDSNKDILKKVDNRDALFRECLKQYGMKLSYRFYYSLNEEEKARMFENSFFDSISIVLKRQDKKG